MREEKLKRFINDEVMSNAVYEVLQKSFLRSRGQRDIQLLAAERLALDLLDAAWKELDRFSVSDENPSQTLNQVGL